MNTENTACAKLIKDGEDATTYDLTDYFQTEDLYNAISDLIMSQTNFEVKFFKGDKQ